MGSQATRYSGNIRDEVQLAMFRRIPPWTAFVDPGETCGMILTRQASPHALGDSYDQHYVAVTLAEADALEQFARWAVEARKQHKYPNLIIEQFRLYPDKIAIYTGKPVPTAETLGVFCWIIRRAGGRVVRLEAQVKQPTAGMIKHRGIKLLGGSEHAKDAELLMWHSILQNMRKEELIG